MTIYKFAFVQNNVEDGFKVRYTAQSENGTYGAFYYNADFELVSFIANSSLVAITSRSVGGNEWDLNFQEN